MFCYKCGSKLMEGALFCAQCGTKIAIDTGTVQIPIQNNTNNTDNRSSEVCNLLKKHLYSIVRTEEKLLLYPGDERKMNSFPSEIVTEYTNKKPLLIFDYMGEGLTSGFIITESTIAYVYGGYGCEYDLAEIESVEIGKAGLATTMVLLFNDNTKSSPLYMTSIREPQG